MQPKNAEVATKKKSGVSRFWLCLFWTTGGQSTAVFYLKYRMSSLYQRFANRLPSSLPGAVQVGFSSPPQISTLETHYHSSNPEYPESDSESYTTQTQPHPYINDPESFWHEDRYEGKYEDIPIPALDSPLGQCGSSIPALEQPFLPTRSVTPTAPSIIFPPSSTLPISEPGIALHFCFGTDVQKKERERDREAQATTIPCCTIRDHLFDRLG